MENFKYLTEAESSALSPEEFAIYKANVRKQWVYDEAYDRAVGISVGKYDSYETLQKEHRADKADYSREMFLGCRLP